jgi:hypothetical protein
MKFQMPCFAFAAVVLLSSCAETYRASLSAASPVEPANEVVRTPVLPPLAGVRVYVGGTWLDLYCPPTIQQVMLQAGGKSSFELDQARSVHVARADGRQVIVSRRNYGSFLLEDGDRISVPIYP